jgi:hypothetical protein
MYGAAAMTIAVGIKQFAPSIIAWIREHYNHKQH